MAPFARHHLRFLDVEGVWMPALIFADYLETQDILQQANFKGFDKVQDQLAKLLVSRLIMRSQLKQSTTGRVAIVLGDAKQIVWEEEIANVQPFHYCLGLLVQDSDYVTNHAWKKALREACDFLEVQEILPKSEDVQLKPAAKQVIHPVTDSAMSTSESACEPSAERSLLDSPTVNESIGDCWDNNEGIHAPKDTSDGEEMQPHAAAVSCAAKPALATTAHDPHDAPGRLPLSAREAVAQKVEKTQGISTEKQSVTKTASLSKNAKHSLTPSLRRRTTSPRDQTKSPVVCQGAKHALSPALRGKRTSPRHRPSHGVKFHQSVMQFEIPNKVESARDDPSDMSEQEIAEEYKVPTTREVLPILRQLGYKTVNSKYYRPGCSSKEKKNLQEGVHYFSSIGDLRRFLCQRGVEMRENVGMPDDLKETLEKWVRYSICPGLRNETEIPIESRKPLPRIHKQLLELGFLLRGTTYFLPGAKPERKHHLFMNGFAFEGPDGLVANLCRFGLPESSNFQNITASERLRLDLYLADCPEVNTYDFMEDTENTEKFERALSEVSSKSTSFVETPIAGNRSSDAAFSTATHVSDNGSVTADSSSHTVVTNCSDVSTVKERINSDNGGSMSPARKASPSVSPTPGDEDCIAEICGVSTQPSTPARPNSPKLLFRESPAEINEKILHHADQDHQTLPSRTSMSPGRTDSLLALSAYSVDKNAAGDSDEKAATDDDTVRNSTPVKPVDTLNQALSPDQDTMNKEMEGFSPPPVNDHGSPDADDLVMTYDTSTFSNEEAFGGNLLTQDFPTESDDVNMDSGDVVNSVGDDVNADVDMHQAPTELHTEQMDDDGATQASPITKATKPRSPSNQETPAMDEYDQWIQRLAGLVQPNDCWTKVFKTMKEQGLRWVYVSGGLHLAAFTFPGRQEPAKGGTVMHDFVYEEFDLQELAVRSLNWKGDEKYQSEKEARDCAGRRLRKRACDTSAAKDQKRKKGIPPNKEGQSPQTLKFASPVRSLSLTTPEKYSTVGERLRSCQRVLQVSHRCHISNIEAGQSNKFQAQVNAVEKFIMGTILSKGRHGGTSNAKPILYICGSPGVGKTTAVNWCCDQAERAVRKGEMDGVKEILIGRLKTVLTRDAKEILDDIAGVLGVGRKTMTMKNHKDLLKKVTKKEMVILVIDEVDNMVSARGGEPESGSAKILQSLCELACDPTCKFSLVGISNAVDNAQAKALKKIGMNGSRIPFAPYSRTELVNLVVSRIGNSIVDSKALSFLASKVAAKSGDARAMLELVESAVGIRYDSATDEQLKGGPPDDRPIVSIQDAMKAVKASVFSPATRIDALPETTKLVLFVAVTICTNSPANYTMNDLKNFCNNVLRYENLDPLDFDSFRQCTERLVDQGLLLSNCDADADIWSRTAMPVRFGEQLQDIQAAVADTLETKPVYKKLIDLLATNPSFGIS